VITAEWLLSTAEEKAREIAKDKRADNEEELAEQVAIGAIKYSILRQATGRDVVFDTNTSITFDGDSGPYLQYARARIRSIGEKAREAGITPSCESHEKTYLVERVLAKYSDVVKRAGIVKRAGKELAPHHIVTYLTELTAAFNHFYATEQIINTEDEYSSKKIAITLAVGQVLENGLKILGIPVPQKM
jgi:arginyl-tRNA synthetase